MTTIKMNTTEFQNKVLAELETIREMLSSSTPTSSTKKEKKERKPRDPNAAPNPWIVFTGRVRDVLKAANLPAGKECQQFASHLKTTNPDAYSMTDEEIEAARSDWIAPEAKPTASKPAASKKSKATATPDTEVTPAVDEDGVPVAKPKRVLSEEQKAKMAAGRKAAAERKKAQAQAQAPAPAPAPTPAPVTVEKKLRPFPYKGKKLLWDTETNGTWLKNDDGSQGAWFGLLSEDRKTVDMKAANPDA